MMLIDFTLVNGVEKWWCWAPEFGPGEGALLSSAQWTNTKVLHTWFFTSTHKLANISTSFCQCIWRLWRKWHINTYQNVVRTHCWFWAVGHWAVGGLVSDDIEDKKWAAKMWQLRQAWQRGNFASTKTSAPKLHATDTAQIQRARNRGWLVYLSLGLCLVRFHIPNILIGWNWLLPTSSKKNKHSDCQRTLFLSVEI